MGNLVDTLAAAGTTCALYVMLGFPFLIWSGRTSYASAMLEVNGRPRGWPGRAATVWLAILPLLLIAYYFVSGIGRLNVEHLDIGVATATVQEYESEWGPWLFLWLPPCVGMIAGYFVGAIIARNRKERL
ncbi:hypothetical protein QBK99_03565 [Corticibacterium sp. UT-5YL-CI-8]|nr:hypothetical protein [Tianweitania sp. UT-5YL-CI-8]